MRRFVLGVVVGALVGALGMAVAQNTVGIPWEVIVQTVDPRPTATEVSPLMISGNAYLRESGSFRMWYVIGLVDGFHVVTVEANTESDRAALDARLKLVSLVGRLGGTDSGQLRDVVVQYMERNPAQRHNSAALLVWRALAEAEWR